MALTGLTVFPGTKQNYNGNHFNTTEKVKKKYYLNKILGSRLIYLNSKSQKLAHISSHTFLIPFSFPGLNVFSFFFLPS